MCLKETQTSFVSFQAFYYYYNDLITKPAKIYVKLFPRSFILLEMFILKAAIKLNRRASIKILFVFCLPLLMAHCVQYFDSNFDHLNCNDLILLHPWD